MLLIIVAASASAQNTFPTTGNVGIGISTPSTLLHVNGTARVSDLQLQGASMKISIPSTTGGWARGMVYYDSGVYSGIELGGIGLKGTGTTLEHIFIGFGNDPWASSIGINVKSNGNVGIGLTNPSEKLDIIGNIKASGSLSGERGYFQSDSDAPVRIYSTDPYTGIEFKDSSSSDFLWYNGQHKTFAIGSSGASILGKKLHIHGGTSIGVAHRGQSVPTNGLTVEGNVGIGLTVPSHKLQVHSSNIPTIAIGKANENTNGASRLHFYAGDASIGNGFQLQYNKDVTTDRLSFIDGGLQEVMTISNGGNVGIGTTSPSAKLEVVGPSNNPSIVLGNENQIAFKRADGLSVYGIGHYQGEFTIGRSANLGANAGTSINIATGGSYTRFSHGANEMMRITSAGNVGIGTALPNRKLEVNGDLAIGLTTSAYKSLVFKPVSAASGYNGTLEIESYTTPGSGTATFLTHFKTTDNGSGGQTRHDVAFDGRIGIGTSSPSEKLQIEDAGSTKIKLHTTSSTSNSGIVFSGQRPTSGNSAHYIGATGDGSYNLAIEADEATFFKNNSVTTMTLNPLGKVGIGTTSPQTELDVKGIIKSTDGVGNTLFLSSGSNGSYIRSFGSQNFSLRDTGGSSKFNFNLSSGDADFDGALGVGNVQVPTGYKLAVGGKVIAEEIKVKLQSSWPDYVFKKDYKLLSVEEVEEYIKKNGHLPKMPSAKEVEKEGFELGEMNKKLLEKIEELTLYTIQQEKRINQLMKRVETLEEK